MTNEYFKKYRDLIIKFNNNYKSVKYVTDFFYDKINIDNSLSKDVFIDVLSDTHYNPAYIRYRPETNKISYGDISYLDSSDYNKIEKLFSLEDIKSGLIKNLILIGQNTPNYKPKNIERTLEQKNNESMKKLKNFLSFDTNESLLLEKSSLTTLGVHREVMQSIQRDLAIPADAKWDRINLKSETENILQNQQKELILQIATDAIKIFVSYPDNEEQIYFIDSYIMKDDGWSGEYFKQKRQFTTKTQLFYHIEPRTLLYRLKSDFSLKNQPNRNVDKKEKEFDKFTMTFKKDFLEKFDNILKRIVGNKFDDAKKEIRDKAKQIELENQMMISGLDDPLEGHNSLTILDEFLYQFEDEYSNFFDERIELQELCDYFSREKVMTSFMYFIYTGKIITK